MTDRTFELRHFGDDRDKQEEKLQNFVGELLNKYPRYSPEYPSDEEWNGKPRIHFRAPIQIFEFFYKSGELELTLVSYVSWWCNALGEGCKVYELESLSDIENIFTSALDKGNVPEKVFVQRWGERGVTDCRYDYYTPIYQKITDDDDIEMAEAMLAVIGRRVQESSDIEIDPSWGRV